MSFRNKLTLFSIVFRYRLMIYIADDHVFSVVQSGRTLVLNSAISHCQTCKLWTVLATCDQQLLRTTSLRSRTIQFACSNREQCHFNHNIAVLSVIFQVTNLQHPHDIWAWDIIDNFVTINHRYSFMTSSLTSQILDQLYPRGPYRHTT